MRLLTAGSLVRVQLGEPRRGKSFWARRDFFTKNHCFAFRTAATLSQKSVASLRLFACKRALNAFACFGLFAIYAFGDNTDAEQTHNNKTICKKAKNRCRKRLGKLRLLAATFYASQQSHRVAYSAAASNEHLMSKPYMLANLV